VLLQLLLVLLQPGPFLCNNEWYDPFAEMPMRRHLDYSVHPDAAAAGIRKYTYDYGRLADTFEIHGGLEAQAGGGEG
jgi:hypothetical protein